MKETYKSKINPQRIAIAISAGVGILSCFMPWARLPIIGSVNGIKEGGIVCVILLLVALLVSLSGDKTKKMDKKYISISAVIGIVVLAISFLSIALFDEKMRSAEMAASRSIDQSSYSKYLSAESRKTAKDFSSALISSASIEFGLYLLILSSISLTGCSILNSLFGNEESKETKKSVSARHKVSN